MTKSLTTLLIALSTTLFAQDQVAKDVLDRLSATTKSYKNMTVGFDFIFENKNQNINEKQKGTLVLQEEMFRLEMEEQIIINDGESQWIYLTDMNEVQIMEHDPEEQMMSPKKLFTIYEEGYKYNYVGTESEEGKHLHIIDLFPTKSSAFMKVILAVDAAKNQLHKITILDKNGGTYSYLVSSLESNTTIASFTFNSTNYPGIEVIDLR
ncbi:MAG: outer membrane lipoprotein carrier protein LolA [Flavobacteriales bacterium]|jgi:outer membrane lipoprotein-sorting protein|nr:outer membrane lipoprotein carrier protein LolA [Flavobacteriales bacterium]